MLGTSTELYQSVNMKFYDLDGPFTKIIILGKYRFFISKKVIENIGVHPLY